ncbi:hypothetical protein THRCLA_08714 [Thraustotheca clavata]|uniref:Uncharacterized protein n=1 Tax=Thraustotheca clavata TaxID=74557 RepID=A0A1V9Z323_9STRA|nr:hypothetical protein THRCLA_08714 [Thraustotheca clavata]
MLGRAAVWTSRARVRWQSSLSIADELILLIKQSQQDDEDARDFLRASEAIDFTATDAYGSTALTLAARGGHVELCRDILSLLPPSSSVLNLANMFGSTPLMCASASGHVHVCTVLLQVPGVDVNVRTRYGSTALSKAAEAGHAAIVDQLLARGAQVIPNALGKSPYELAQAKGHELPQLLPTARARVTSIKDANLLECWLESTGEYVLVEKKTQMRVGVNAAVEILNENDRWTLHQVSTGTLVGKQRCLHPRRPFEKKCIDCPERR